MKRITFLIALLLSLFIMAACQTLPNTVALQTQSHSWIDAPLDGSQLPLAPVEIVAHSSDLLNIVSVELSVNGNVLATVTNPNPSLLAVARQTWTPLASGNYAIRVRASNSSGVWGEYAQANVTIGNTPATNTPNIPASAITNTPSPSTTPLTVPSISPAQPLPSVPTQASAPNAPKPTQTHTPQPTHTHTPQPTKTLEVVTKPTLNDHAVSTSQFYWGGGNCTPKQVTFKVSASDPSGIASVQIHFRLAAQSNWSALAMTGSGGNWSRTIDSENDVPGYSSDTSTEFLQFYFVLTNTRGQQTQSQTFANNVSLSYCPAIK